MPQVQVVSVVSVEPFPGRTNLDINTLSDGAVCMSDRANAGDPSRYQPNDLVIRVPEGLIAPEWLLKRQGCWLEGKGKGTLKGGKGNRTCNRVFKVMDGDAVVGEKLSEGMLLACERDGDGWVYRGVPDGEGTRDIAVVSGQDVKADLGLVDYVG